MNRSELAKITERLKASGDPRVRRGAEAAQKQLTGRPASEAARAALARAGERSEAKRRAKYGNKSVLTPDGRFDSAGEARRWEALKRLQETGEICGLMRQVTIPLISGTPQDRACSLKIDFLYVEAGQLVCEDFKGFETATWIIKRKLFREKYPRTELRVTKRS